MDSFDASGALQIASRVAARTHMRDIRLIRSSSEIISLPPSGALLSYDLHIEPSVEYHDGDEAFVVRACYRVSIFLDESEDAASSVAIDDRRVAEVSFDYAALYLLAMQEDDAAPKAEELEAFAATTGQLALYPFARQFVYDMTGRLALPQLALDVFVVHIPGDDTDA